MPAENGVRLPATTRWEPHHAGLPVPESTTYGTRDQDHLQVRRNAEGAVDGVGAGVRHARPEEVSSDPVEVSMVTLGCPRVMQCASSWLLGRLLVVVIMVVLSSCGSSPASRGGGGTVGRTREVAAPTPMAHCGRRSVQVQTVLGLSAVGR